MYQEIKNKKIKDHDPQIIAWERAESQANEEPLIHVYPQPGDNIKKKNYFTVKDYEKALFYNKGELIGVLGGGIYEIDKKAKVKGTEIVWIDTSIKEIRWGVPQASGIPTKDGLIVGLHGTLKFRINDVKTFYQDVVAGKRKYNIENLKRWIMDLLHTSIRDIFKNHLAKTILLEERDRIINLMIAKVSEEFLKYGLELESFNLIGIKVPEGMESLYEVDRKKVSVSEELEMLEMNKKLEEKKRELEIARKALKREEELLDAKAKYEKASYLAKAKEIEGITEAALLEKREKAKIAGEIDLINTKGQKEIKIAEIKEKFAIEKEDEKVKREEIIKQEIKELNEKIETFDNLLVEGKISEDTYKMRIQQIEKRLKDLERKLHEY
ncbi:MAG: SPFH domain-containing protein [Promethearchaeota archaeon]